MSNLKQLEVFAAVVECGSFTEAANQFYMAQSTVGSHIRGLEGLPQVSLFHRPQLPVPRYAAAFSRERPDCCGDLPSGQVPAAFCWGGASGQLRESRLPVKRKPFGRFCGILIGGCVSPYSFKGDIWRICALHLRGCTSIIKSQKQKLEYCPRVRDFCRCIGGYACAYSSAAGGG